MSTEQDEPTPEQRRSLFRVFRGAPEPDELAALAAVVAAAASGTGGTRPERRPDLWSNPATLLRAPLTPGPGAWKASALPR